MNEKKEKPVIINLFGAPGVGKSLIMSGLVYHLKQMGLNVEETPEFVKELCFEEAKLDRLGGQLYILSEQNKRIARLLDRTDFIITDCPLVMIGAYTPPEYIEGFEDMAVNVAKRYNNYNVFINRNPEFDFENENRFHNENQSDEKAIEIKNFLKKYDQKFEEYQAGDYLVSTIIDSLIENNIVTLEHLKKSRTPSVRKKYSM